VNSDNRRDALRARKYGLLWFGAEGNGWSITDPTSEQLDEALHRLRYETDGEQGERLRRDILTVLRAAEDYQHLTTYDLGVEHIVKKLRVIWRALRR
jgi:hypothetical protein